MRFQHLLLGCLVAFALTVNGMNAPNGELISFETSPVGRSPVEGIPDDFDPVWYKIFNKNTGQHHENTDIEDYSSDVCVLIDPEKYQPGKLQARMDQRKQDFADGRISQEEYETENHNDAMLNEAMKVITFQNKHCGALLVIGVNHVYYHGKVPEKEIERRIKSDQVAQIWLKKDTDQFHIHYPWLQKAEDGTNSEASSSRHPDPS